MNGKTQRIRQAIPDADGFQEFRVCCTFHPLDAHAALNGDWQYITLEAQVRGIGCMQMASGWCRTYRNVATWRGGLWDRDAR